MVPKGKLKSLIATLAFFAPLCFSWLRFNRVSLDSVPFVDDSSLWYTLSSGVFLSRYGYFVRVINESLRNAYVQATTTFQTIAKLQLWVFSMPVKYRLHGAD